MRILLVEDDKKLQQIIKKHLEGEGYVVDLASELHTAQEKVTQTAEPDLILLDVLLPDGDGIAWCKQLRESAVRCPIIMLTARNSTVDKITGLDAGADDYMPKPFSPLELSARVRAILRRPEHVIYENVSCGNLTLKTSSRSAVTPNSELKLMPKEYSLLEYLMRKKNQVVRKDELLRNVWGVYSLANSNRLEVYIRYLRGKLVPSNCGVTIKTVRGVGYLISDE